MDEIFKQDMRELHRRINLLLKTGFIDRDAYNVGMQVMAHMVADKSREVVLTWHEMAQTLVWDSKHVAGDAAVGLHFTFTGAIQHAEERIGLVSHVDREGLEAHLIYGREKRDFCHFTREPGVDSNIIGPQTRLIFVYEPWVCGNLDKVVDEYTAQAKYNLSLPKWLTAGNKHASTAA